MVRKELSIVIPVYNEAGCLEANMTTLLAYLAGLETSWEVLLVDDGSSDNTASIAQRFAAETDTVRFTGHARNRGKGYAVRTGMLQAQGEFRVFMDADLAVPVEFTGNCLRQLQQGADISIGSRHLSASVYKIPEGAVRTFLGKVYRRFAIDIFGLSISDITCGLKGFSARATDDVFTRSCVERWGYDAEILFLAEKLGYAIHEFPVDWYHSFDSNVRLGRDVPQTFYEMVVIWLNYLSGRYRLR